MPNRLLHLAAYDISCAKRLRLALHVLKGYSTGGQKSVFECYLTAVEKEQLLKRISTIIDPREDRFLLLALDTVRPVYTLGIAVAPSDPPFYYAG